MHSAIILVNKPRGLSSNAVVNIVKKTVGAKKAGHLGTLDVEGEGLLPVTLERATKLFDLYLQKDKVYKTTFRFGQTTDTLDLEGKITAKDDKIISKEEVERVLPLLVGKINQMPPAYSAKKIKGRKAYDLAREGKDVQLKPKLVEIYSIKLLSHKKQNEFEFEVHCSSGTYIRSLCRDMAEKLSTYGVMLNIIRTKCGDFDLKDAYTLEEIKAGKYKEIAMEELFDFEKKVLTQEEKDKLLSAGAVKMDLLGKFNAFYDGQFLGVIEGDGEVVKFLYRFVL